MRKVILDVDTGTDDSIALMLAVLSKKFDILGITVTWGNQHVEDCAQNTLRVLDFLGSDIPVYQGCPEAMVKSLSSQRDKNNTENGISYYDEDGNEHCLHPKVLPFDEPKHQIQNKHAVTFLIETLLNSKEKITLIPVGPCTNIGMAIRMEPKIVDHIEEIVFMGGSIYTGNVTPTAEANFWHDPEAVKIILNSGVNCTLTALDATMSAPLTLEMVRKMEESDSKAIRKTAEIIKIRMDVSQHLGWTDGTIEPLHDPLAVAYLIDDSVILQKERFNLDMDISGGIKDGSLIIDTTKPIDEHSPLVLLQASNKKYYEILTKYLGEY